MSSTERDRHAQRLRRFFDERLIPAAEAVRKRRGELFALGPDPGQASYFVPRNEQRMTPERFEVDGLESPERLGQMLGDFWKRRGMPELAALAPELAEIAGELREVEEESDEVSPFIYVMF